MIRMVAYQQTIEYKNEEVKLDLKHYALCT